MGSANDKAGGWVLMMTRRGWVLLMTKRGGGCYVDEKAGCALLMTKAAVWGLLRTGRWGVKFPGM